jgi:hypothetical protein
MTRRPHHQKRVAIRPESLCAVATVVLGVLVACKGPPAPHVSLSSVAPLRSAFNADSGKVRTIFLASPT